MARACVARSVSRIHITLIDLLGGIGRVDGGAGTTLDSPRFIVRARAVENSSSIDAKGRYREIVEKCSRAILERICRSCGAEVEVIEGYDLHVGLGAVTQLCLSTASSLASSLGLNIESWEIARIVNRGGTSGIGVYAFRLGGFIVDGGHRYPHDKQEIGPSDLVRAPPPPLISRIEIPINWGFILIRPRRASRIYGDRESMIFREASNIAEEEVWRLSHRLLMGLMPSIASKDLEGFARHVREIQDLGFKRIEWSYQDPIVWRLRKTLDELAIPYGLSSMGPTVYIPCLENECEETLRAVLKKADIDIETRITRGRNKGAEIYCE
jgi:beta-ribofuranosylaminobenzene 5'-phosphate synthase